MARAPVECPVCGAPVELPPEGRDWTRCRSCGSDVQTTAQLALARAEALFGRTHEERERPFVRVGGPGFRDTRWMQGIQRAYSGVQYALQYDLPRHRLERALELMAGISQLLARRGIASQMEAAYWGRVLALRQLRARRADIATRVEAADRRSPGGWVRWLWLRLRLWRVDISRRATEQQLRGLEGGIDFAEPPRLEGARPPPRWLR